MPGATSGALLFELPAGAGSPIVSLRTPGPMPTGPPETGTIVALATLLIAVPTGRPNG